MIKHEEIREIGSFIKPHGITGEITTLFPSDIDPDTLSCIVLDMDGIFVPFFIEEWRPKATETILIHLEGINDEQRAKEFAGKTVYALRRDLPDITADESEEGGFYAADLIGFEVKDADGTTIGTVTDFDDQTENILLLVRKADGSTLYVPLAEDLICGFDPHTKYISIDIPQGLDDLS